MGSTRSFSSSSTTTCSLSSKRSTLRKALTGSWSTSVWTWLLPSSCLRNLWVSGPSSRKSLFSLRQLISPLRRNLRPLGKLPVFLKPQSKTDKNAHFAISHYAGIVSYNVTGWLEKNKDPVNDSVVEVFKSTSTCELLVLLWADHPGQPTTAPKEEGKKKKKGGGKTVSSVYLVSLVDLMNTH